MKSISEILKTFLVWAENFLWLLGMHAFLLILLLLLADIFFGGVIFYKYVYLAEREPPNISGSVTKFNEKSYQDVLEEMESEDQSIVPATPTAGLPNLAPQPQNNLPVIK
jgi:hypothetical protein